MAAALAKVICGGRCSGAFSQQLLPATGRLIVQKDVLPHLRTSPAASAAGKARLMHTGHGRSSVFARTKLPFGEHGVPSRQKPVSMEQFTSKRLYVDIGDRPSAVGLEVLEYVVGAMFIVSAVTVGPPTVSCIWERLAKKKKEQENYDEYRQRKVVL